MSNVAGKAYAMNVLTPMPVRKTWINRLIFNSARAFPKVLAGLMGLKLIHFARWVIIKREQWPPGDRGPQHLKYDCMLFCSNFNGTWDQYIDAFSDGLASGLDLFWYSSVKYPKSIPIAPFKQYISHNQFHTNYYYNATPGSAQRDIRAAMRLREAIKRLAALPPNTTPDAFAKAYRKELVAAQNCFASPGLAPIASTDTWNADANRGPYLTGKPTGPSGPKECIPLPWPR
jgi:hypothetical protein